MDFEVGSSGTVPPVAVWGGEGEQPLFLPTPDFLASAGEE